MSALIACASVIALAIGVNALAGLISRKVMNVEEFMEAKKKLDEWYAKLSEAKKEGSEKRIRKLRKKEHEMRVLRGILTRESMKRSIVVLFLYLFSLFILVPLIGVFILPEAYHGYVPSPIHLFYPLTVIEDNRVCIALPMVFLLAIFASLPVLDEVSGVRL